MSSPCCDTIPPKARQELIATLGPRAILDRKEDLALYEYDGSVDRARPAMVVFPRSTEDVVRIVEITGQYNIPMVGRGASLNVAVAGSLVLYRLAGLF